MVESSEFEPGSVVDAVAISFDAHTSLITLKGEIDLAIGEALNFAANEAIIRRLPVQVDLTEVMFMDSTGVGLLAQLAKAGVEGGWRLTVVGPNRVVRDTLQVSGLLPALEVHQVEQPSGRRSDE